MWRRDSSGWRERQPYDPDRSAGSLRGVGERHEATAPRATEAGFGDATASEATSFCSLCLFYPNSHAGASAWPFAAASACAFLSSLSVVLSVACAVVVPFALLVAIAACFRRLLLPGSHRWRFSVRGCCRPRPRRGLSPGPRRRRRRRRPFLFPVAVLRPLAAPVQRQEVVAPAANVNLARGGAALCTGCGLLSTGHGGNYPNTFASHVWSERKARPHYLLDCGDGRLQCPFERNTTFNWKENLFPGCPRRAISGQPNAGNGTVQTRAQTPARSVAVAWHELFDEPDASWGTVSRCTPYAVMGAM